MRSLLKKLFIDNWQRKIVALILALITWFFVNHSLTISKTVSDVPIRVTNLPKDKAIKGMQSDGLLSNFASIEIQGNKNLIDRLTNSDLEILLDLKDNIKDVYSTIISKSNLISKNSTINIERAIKKIKPQELTIQLSKFAIEKIPIVITQPIGVCPKSYQLLDVWPYILYLTVSGPEEVLKNLKAKGLKLTFDLNSITEGELDAIDAINKRGRKNVVSFFIPTPWKRINIPEISMSPIDIDDPNAKTLRIDFIKKDFIPINTPIPIMLFFPNSISNKLNPSNITIANNDFVKKINGIDMLTIPLYVQGISQTFIDTTHEKIFILIQVEPNEDKKEMEWHVQTVFPRVIESSFIKNYLAEKSNDTSLDLQNPLLEDYLKIQFRSYLNKFRLWISPNEKLYLKIILENNKIYITPTNK